MTSSHEGYYKGFGDNPITPLLWDNPITPPLEKSDAFHKIWEKSSFCKMPEKFWFHEETVSADTEAHKRALVSTDTLYRSRYADTLYLAPSVDTYYRGLGKQ